MWLIVALVTLLVGVSLFIWRRSRLPEPAPARGVLPAPERTLASLRLGDVVSHLGEDLVVDGTVTLDLDGRVARLYLLSDGRWLAALPGDDGGLLLSSLAGVGDRARGAERLVEGGLAYRLATDAAVRPLVAGALVDRLPTTPARLCVYLGPGAARLLSLAWDERVEVLGGERVSPSALDLLPAS